MTISSPVDRKMSRVYHNQNFDNEVEASENFQTLYQTVTELKSGE